MIARHIERRPAKSLLSVLGIASACGIMMVGNFQQNSVDFMVHVQFGLSQREDLQVSFVEPTAHTALYELRSLRGVRYVEGFRAVPVRLRFEHRSYRTAVQGVEPGGELMRVLDMRLQPVALPPAGLVLTDYLGQILGLRPGDRVVVEVLDGSRPVREVQVAAFTKQYIGVQAYMQRQALNRLLGEGDVLSGAYLAADRQYWDGIYAALKERPRVLGTVVHEVAIASFYDTVAESVLFFSFIATLLGATIAFGVVYNSARIALSERSRELASLRVLGFTRGEIAYILLGELAVLTLAAIPLGLLIGEGLCAYLAFKFQSDLYRIPLVVDPPTFALAAAVVLVSAAISGYLVWRRLSHLDLVAVLKTRE
jgi:putative ABC transport system permease protein